MLSNVITTPIGVMDAEISSLTEAFTRGVRDFYLGQRVPAKLTTEQNKLKYRRQMALQKGNDSYANSIYYKHFLTQGIHLVDTVVGSLITTRAEKSIDPANPYRDGTLLAKEWQRGVNSAYSFNLIRIREREKKLETT